MQKEFEILSPGGSFEKAKYALEFGADAVYVGIPELSVRARINKFDIEGLGKMIEYAHGIEKKVYVTVNIFVHDRHLDVLKKCVREVAKFKPDGFILSDPGALRVVKEVAPGIDIHLSTQMNCTNTESAKFWYEQGVKRIILARDLNLEEIKKIHKEVPELEIECFVHGSMCMSYSGRCFLTNYFSPGRNANLGTCNQPCRWEYDVMVKERGSGKEMQVEEDDKGTNFLNVKDLCLIDEMDKLIEAGVTVFKIEGRTKSLYYAAMTAKWYREALDIYLGKKEGDVSEIKKELVEGVDSRGFSKGFLEGVPKEDTHNWEGNEKHAKWQFCGEAHKKVDKGHLFKVHNVIYKGEEVELVLSGDRRNLKLDKLIKWKKGNNMEEVESIHGGVENEWLYTEGDFGDDILGVLRKRA